MGKGLIITEKPSVSRDIVEALGGFEEKDGGNFFERDDLVCTFAVGHILTLLAPEDISETFRRWRLADLPILPETFDLKPLPSQGKRVKTITKLLKRKDIEFVINACDAAREGELIFREILDYLKCQKPTKRLWLQSMTKLAIREGMTKLADGADFEGLGEAARCRAQADWLIGMNATRALTVRLKSRSQRGMSWSAGRVQTPTLGLLVNRELEILTHDFRPYWRVHCSFQTSDHSYRGTWIDPSFKRDESQRDLKEDRIFSVERAQQILQQIAHKPALAKEQRKPSPKKPPLLFDLTTLQRTANSRFGWTATRTLRAAQRCYETHKVLTYPRTSSKFLPNDYRPVVDGVLQVLKKVPAYEPYASRLIKQGRLNENKVFNDAGITDHFAIVPTGEIRHLEGDDQRIFDLVCRQFMAAFYPPAVYEDVERATVVEGYHFKSKPPKVLTDPGWEVVFGKTLENAKEEVLPPLKAGQKTVDNVSVQSKEGDLEELETKPPSRISEAGLLSLMENAGRQVVEEELASALKQAEGLGTAATRADIIENLKVREYVDKDLRPTVKGIRLIDILHRTQASRLTSAKLTGELELYLTQVEHGSRTAESFVGEIVQYVEEVITAMKDFEFDEIYPDECSLGRCPKCQEPVYEKAWFYGCHESTKRQGQRTCDFLIWKDNNGRYIDTHTVKKLLTEGETRELDGFRSADGSSYKATLKIVNGEIIRESSTTPAGEGFDIDETPLGVCPDQKCGKECEVVETSHEFICRSKLAAKQGGQTLDHGFSFPRMLCRREITREEVVKYLNAGETDFLTGFVSKKGRKFSAKLVKDHDSNGFQFVFPERRVKRAEQSAD